MTISKIRFNSSSRPFTRSFICSFNYSTLSLLALVLTACSTTGHLPSDLTENSLDRQTIVILGTNDIHGALAPIESVSREANGQPGTPYTRGGAAMLAAHVQVLRTEFGSNFLLLDAGDEFQGSLESNGEEGAPMVKFFNQIGVTAATIGNHEFDFGPAGSPDNVQTFRAQGLDPLGALKQRLTEAKYPYVAANLVETKTGRTLPLPNTSPSKLIQVGKVPVGIIGLTTLETPTSTRPEYVEGITFSPLAATTLREAKILRNKGAKLVLVVAHVGLKCEADGAPSAPRFWKESDPQGRCGENDELVRMLKDLPSGTVDGVVSGHSHQVVHHWVEGVPVIQAGTRSLYQNLLYLTVDLKSGEVIKDRTRIEGPTPICEKVFENQNDCNGDRNPPKNGRGDLVTPTLHGQSLYPEPLVEKLLAPTFEQTAAQKKRVVAQADRAIEHSRTTESSLGGMIADAVRKEARADFALVNPGGIRASLDAGPITYESVFRVLPFDNFVSRLRLNGKELKLLLRIANSGIRGFFSTSGLRLKMIELSQTVDGDDLNHDGKIEPWEYNRLVEVTTLDGKKIHDNQWYTLGTIDFLVSGGDDLGWFMKQIPASRIERSAGGLIRDVFESYLTAAKTVPSALAPGFDAQHPRLVTVRAPDKKKSRPRRARTNKSRR